MNTPEIKFLTSLVSSLLLVSTFGCGPSEARKEGGETTTVAVAAQDKKLVAAWSFEEGIGTAIADASGGGNAATLQGGAAWAKGLVGKNALSLTGAAGSFVDIPKPVIDTTRSFTVTACVKLKQLNGFQTVVSIDGDQSSGFFLQLRDDTGSFGFTRLASDSGRNDATVAGANDSPDLDTWYHLTGVYDDKTRTISLYVNGVLQESKAFTSPWKANGHTAIGRGKFGGNPVDFVKGDIDEVRLYQEALTEAEIQALAKADLAAAPAATVGSTQPAALQIDLAKAKGKVSPIINGLMTEEINFAYEGGLYAELIRNRAFKDKENEAEHWSLVTKNGGAGTMTLDKANPLNKALPVSAKLEITSASEGKEVGIANGGYWGIPVTPNTRYQASFYAKAAPGFSGPITASIESSDGTTTFAKATVSKISGEWKKYEVTLTTDKVAPSKTNRFVLSAKNTGTVYLTQVSLFPPTYKNRPNGSRIDLMEKMKAMKPSFLRFPGGNYLEGNTIAERFDWKKTIGDVAERPGHQCPWGYWSSDGFGLMEFLYWCEDLNMEPVLGVFAGYALGGEYIAAGPKLEPFVQDALDEIEFLTGDTSTKWGAMRAKLGHPKPFALTYVEVGNEDWFDRSGSYDGRFAQFYDAIKKKYPKIQIIATTGVKSRKPDVMDEHYYRAPRQFERSTNQYDSYDRNGVKIFVGEWASQVGRPTPDFSSALGDAAFMTGVERNADIVIMQAYAPLFVNINPDASQWGTNLIGYDALSSYGSPSFYVLSMFGQNGGDERLTATLTGGKRLNQSVTRDSKTGIVYVKLTNPTDTAQPVKFTLTGAGSVDANGTAIVLKAGKLNDTNTIHEPMKIAPVTEKVGGLGKTFDYSLAPFSVTVLKLGTK